MGMSEEYRQKLDARLKRLMGRSGPPTRPEDKEDIEAFSAAGKRFRSFWKSLIAKVEGTSEAVKRLEATPAEGNRAAGEANDFGWVWKCKNLWEKDGVITKVKYGRTPSEVLQKLLKCHPGESVVTDWVSDTSAHALRARIMENCKCLGIKMKVTVETGGGPPKICREN